MDNLLQFCTRQTVLIDAGNRLKKASFINHVRVFELFLITSFFCHNLRTCSPTNDSSQTINLSDNQLLC